MKIHFGFRENFGDYESPLWGCDVTVCGCQGEIATENATVDWNDVTCKKCLRIKTRIIEGIKEDEKNICKQLGDMAEFMLRRNNYGN